MFNNLFKRKTATLIPSACKYCPCLARVVISWPDGDEDFVCEHHAEFIVAGMGEVNALITGLAA